MSPGMSMPGATYLSSNLPRLRRVIGILGIAKTMKALKLAGG